MAKVEKTYVTPMWVKIKNLYESETNGSYKYGSNFKIGGELDNLTREFIDVMGNLTREFGWDCKIEDVKLDIWKLRVWTVVENAGLLPEIAWRDDKNPTPYEGYESDDDYEDLAHLAFANKFL
tara:strand:- start:113 stop:481 length:369 start_codon:yes stop_codon:yes gene_type:complete